MPLITFTVMSFFSFQYCIGQGGWKLILTAPGGEGPGMGVKGTRVNDNFFPNTLENLQKLSHI